MDITKTLSPITKEIKLNKNMINFVLVFVVLLMLFPYNYFLPYDLKNRVESQLKRVVSSPWVMALITVLVYAVYVSGDVYMFILTLSILHRLTLH